MRKNSTRPLISFLMALALLVSFVLPAFAADINQLRPFDVFSQYGTTGDGKGTLYASLFPGDVGLIAGGAINGQTGPNGEPVFVVISNTTDQPINIGYDVDHGFFGKARSEATVMDHLKRTERGFTYVKYVETPATEAAVVALVPVDQPAPAASNVKIQNFNVPVDISQCRWGDETDKGQAKVFGFKVLPGELGLAFGWKIDGTTGGTVRKSFSEGNQAVAIEDGFVVVCSTAMTLHPEVFDGYRLIDTSAYAIDGQHLLTQPEFIQQSYFSSCGNDWVCAARKWRDVHNQALINEQKNAAPSTPAQPSAPVQAAAPAPAPASGKPVRFANPGPLNFEKGESVFGAYIKVDGANNAVGMCYYTSAPNSGSVSGGVIGRLPFQQEINEQKLVSCG